MLISGKTVRNKLSLKARQICDSITDINMHQKCAYLHCNLAATLENTMACLPNITLHYNIEQKALRN